MKSRWILYALIALTITAAFVNSPFLWMLCIAASTLYAEMRVLELRAVVKAQEEVSVSKLAETAKILGDLVKNAFDNMNKLAAKVERTLSAVGEHTSKIHRLERKSNVQSSVKTPYPPETWKKPERPLPAPKKNRKEKE